MPTHTIHCILTQMFHEYKKAPWNFDTWKELTGVRYGLFPDDDEQLPAGWTRQTSNEIGSYFDQFRALKTQDQKHKFSSANAKSSMVPGRQAWRDWVTKGWKKWNIHDRIIDVLRSEELHPYSLAAELNSWPDASQWVPLAIDPVGTALFGEQCYSPRKERVDLALRPTIQALITRTWVALYTSFNRSKARVDILESEAIKAFADLDKDKLSKAKIKAAIVKVMKWKQVAEALLMVDKEETIEEMESELERLMVGLDEKLKPISNKGSKTLCRVTTEMLKSLASLEDIDDVVNLYAECFNSSGGDPTQLEEQLHTINFKFGNLPDGADPGVEIEATMSPSLLATALGFVNVPLLFNTHRHRDGITPWEDPVAFRDVSNEEFTMTQLRWHQLAGVHGVLRRMFSPKPTPEHSGMLIADEVGLGKTLQLLAILACLTECVGRRERGLGPFPLVAENPYLGESNTVPNRSHLIIVPGTILGQWESEVKTALNPKAFDLFVYTTGTAFRQDFWSGEGPFAQSKQQPVAKIILASHSALIQDYRLLFRVSRSRSKELPWRPPTRVTAFDSIVEKTLFGLNYLSVTIDEAHGFRNASTKHSAALAILEKSTVRFIMTATPLQTSTKDLASMARLVGIGHFFTQDAFDEEKADAADIRRAKASLGEDYNPLDVRQRDEDPIRQAQTEVVRRIQIQFERRVLRRTTESKSWEGQSLIKLPKLHEHVALLTLQPFEREVHLHLAKKMRDDLSSCSSMKILSSTFYLPSRMGAIYPRLSLTEKIPLFNSLEEWQSHKSTKIDTCARMCSHLLSRDDAPDMIFQDGRVIFPDVSQSPPGEKVSQDRKILIYQEFPSLGPLLRNVLALYNIRHLFMDGRTSNDCRAKVVSQFIKDPSIRVLIFSSVGSSGLNLSRATAVIFLDQPWSAQDERQVRGRAYRQPQDKEVHCFHLLADETSDVILSALAGGKKDMLETFLQQQEGQDMLQLMTRGVLPDEDPAGVDNLAKEPMPQAHLANTDQLKQAASSISNAQEMNASIPEKDGPSMIPIPRYVRNANDGNHDQNEDDRNDNSHDWSDVDMTDGLTSMAAYGEVMDPLSSMVTDPTPSPPLMSFQEGQHVPQSPSPGTPIGHRRGRSQYRQEHEGPEAQKTFKRPRLISPPEKDDCHATAGGRLTPDSDIEIFDGPCISNVVPPLVVGSEINGMGQQTQTDPELRGGNPISGHRIQDTAQSGYRLVIGSDSEGEQQFLPRKVKVTLGAKAKTAQPSGQDKSAKETTLRVAKQTLVSEPRPGGPSAAPLPKKYDTSTNIRRATMLRNSGTLSPPPRSTASQNPFLKARGQRK